MTKRLAVLAIFLVSAVICFGSSTSAADQAGPKGIEFFETKIRPVLVKSCYECHSSKAAKVKGGLLLDTKAGIRQGAGPAAGYPEGQVIDYQI